MASDDVPIKVEAPVSLASTGNPIKIFNREDEKETTELFKEIVRLCDKAGLNEKCTPKVLRQKLANDMGFGQGGLDGCEAMISKMIIRWWKQKGEEQWKLKKKKDEGANSGGSKPSKSEKEKEKVVKTEKEKVAPSSSSSPRSSDSSSKYTKELYQKLRGLAKDTDRVKLLDGISDLPDTETKIKMLRKRFLEEKGAGFSFSEIPTDKEIETIRGSHKKNDDGIGSGKQKVKEDDHHQEGSPAAKKAKVQEVVEG